MPRTPIGVDVRIRHLGERSVNLLPFRDRGHAVGRRAHQGMPEPHPRAELDQAGLFGRDGRARTQVELTGGSPQDRDVAEGLGGRGQEQAAGVGGQRLELAHERLLEAARQRYGAPLCEPIDQFRGRPCARQLQQREWVAARLGDDPVADPPIDRARDHRVQQRAGVGRAEAADHEFGQARELVGLGWFTNGDDQRDPLRQYAASHEGYGLGRDTIQPLAVVDQAHQRLLLGQVGKQIQDG